MLVIDNLSAHDEQLVSLALLVHLHRHKKELAEKALLDYVKPERPHEFYRLLHAWGNARHDYNWLGNSLEEQCDNTPHWRRIGEIAQRRCEQCAQDIDRPQT